MSEDRFGHTEIFSLKAVKPKEIVPYLVSNITYRLVEDLKENYPNFVEWFKTVVQDDIRLGRNGREIIYSVTKGANGNVLFSGIAVLKRTTTEKKICTIRVHEDFRSKGIGTKLFEKSFGYLGTTKPLMTISERNRDMFKGIISKYGFEETRVFQGKHKTNEIEYEYNGEDIYK